MQTAAALLLALASALTVSGQMLASANENNYACKERSVLENAATIIKAGRRDGTILQSAIVVNAFMQRLIAENDCTEIRKGDRVTIKMDVGDWWIQVEIPEKPGSWYVMRDTLSNSGISK